MATQQAMAGGPRTKFATWPVQGAAIGLRWIGRVIAALALLGGPACAADAIKVAFMAPLSGSFANVGETMLHHAEFVVDHINARGGVLGGAKLELLPMDNKNSPQETLLLLGRVVDNGVRIISYCCGSHAAVPLAEAVERHNARDPQRSILLLLEAGDQELTSDKCSFWTFAFMSKAEMFANAITTFIARQPDIRKVYLVHQDYVWGHQNQRFLREMLARKRPDIVIVGDDLHPLGRVKDFSPYIAKIQSARPDAVITANWGNDMVLLVKAAGEAGLGAQMYTYYGSLWGAPAAMGPAAIDKVKAVFRWHPNAGVESERLHIAPFRQRFGQDYAAMPSANVFRFLAKAIDDGGSADPLRIAYALEDMRITGAMGEVWMRADDHQLFEPLYVMTLTKLNGRDVRHGTTGTNIGTRTDLRLEAAETLVPSTCRMRRPARP